MRLPRPSLTATAETLFVLLGGFCLAAAVLLLGWWSLPVMGVAAVATLALYRLDWALYALVFLLPLTAIGGMAEGYNEVVQAFKRVLLLGLLAAWAVHLLLRKERIYTPRVPTIAILIFGFAAISSVLRAPEPMIALTSTARLLLYCAVYVALTASILNTPERIWRAVWVLLASATLTAAFAFYQLVAFFMRWPTFLNPSYETVYGIPRVHSVMTEPLHLANFLLLVCPLALALFGWRERARARLAGAAAVATTAGILIAASRAGWAIFVLVAVGLPLLARRALQIRRLLLPALAVVTIMVAAVSGIWLRRFGSFEELATYVSRFATFSGDETGAGDLTGRLKNLALITHVLETSPIIGIGTNNVGFQFHEFMTIEGPKISSSGNTYLDTLIETGGLGLAALLTLFGSGLALAWAGFRAYGPRREGALFLGLFVGVLASMIHINFYGSLTWAAHTFFGIGFIVAAHRVFLPASPALPARARSGVMPMAPPSDRESASRWPITTRSDRVPVE